MRACVARVRVFVCVPARMCICVCVEGTEWNEDYFFDFDDVWASKVCVLVVCATQMICRLPRCVCLRVRARVRARVRVCVSVYSRIERISEGLLFGSYFCLYMCVCACICVFEEQMQHAQTCVLSR